MPEMPPAPPFAQQPGAEPKKEEHHSGGLFKHKEQVQPVGMGDISSQMVNLSRRLRVLEERYDGLRKKIQLVEQSMIKQGKEISRETKTTNSETLELRRDLEDLKGKSRLIVKELMGCAKTEEVKILEKYVNLWEPVNFVTRNEVQKIVQDTVNDVLQQIQNNENL